MAVYRGGEGGVYEDGPGATTGPGDVDLGIRIDFLNEGNKDILPRLFLIADSSEIAAGSDTRD